MAAVTLPNNSVKTGYPNGAATWGADMNRNLRLLDALANMRVIDKDLAAPPGSPSSGQTYIVAASPTGAWAGQAGNLAIWQAGDDIAVAGWFFVPPRSGWRAYVVDEDRYYKFATAWTLDASPSTLVTDATTALTALPSAAGNYTRFTNAGTKTYTFTDAQAYVIGAEYHGRNVGAGNLTLAGAGSAPFVLNPPTGGSLVVPSGSTFTVKIVTTTQADVVIR